jgi:hypothetical protein
MYSISALLNTILTIAVILGVVQLGNSGITDFHRFRSEYPDRTEWINTLNGLSDERQAAQRKSLAEGRLNENFKLGWEECLARFFHGYDEWRIDIIVSNGELPKIAGPNTPESEFVARELGFRTASRQIERRLVSGPVWYVKAQCLKLGQISILLVMAFFCCVFWLRTFWRMVEIVERPTTFKR